MSNSKIKGTFASRIKARRLQLGLKNYELAKLAGITVATLSLIESGQSKRPHSLSKIAAGLGTSEAYLKTGEQTRDSLLIEGAFEITPDQLEHTKNRVQSILSILVGNSTAVNFGDLLIIASKMTKIIILLLERNETISDESVAAILNHMIINHQ